ncbi:tannase and feruloyl esterase-domain-containing protein, partial [Macrophomina phaseolina]
NTSSLSLLCSSEQLPTPTLFGAKILSSSSQLVTNYPSYAPEAYNFNHPAVYADSIDFCNVAVTCTHPGHDDQIHVEAWLPLERNDRLQVVGGGGTVAGRFALSYMLMAGAIGEGYATVSTDAGVLVEHFYGRPPKYSYWSGCSQGGRQGLMLVQRYPIAYDGIVASAPATNIPSFAPSLYWPQLVMNLQGKYPRDCEMSAITEAAISACDGKDGVVDEHACDSMTGERIVCRCI